MTDDTSTPGSGFNSASWLLRDQEFITLCKSTLSENKTALFKALAAARIDTVEVTFNGYADEGQIESPLRTERAVMQISSSSTSRLRGSYGVTRLPLARP